MFRTLLLVTSLLLAATSAFGQCGTPSFVAGVNVEVGIRPVEVASGDFNGDGRTDLVIPDSRSNTIYLLLGNVSGVPTVVMVNSVPAPARVGIADFNHDGKLDLAVSHSVSGGGVSVALLFGDGAGAFGPPTDFPATHSSPMVVADFNNDGNPDIFLGNSSTNNSEVLLGNGGGFGAPISVVVPNNSQAVAGDFNNDGKMDLALVDGSISVELGDGAGHFSLANTVTGSALFARAADLNGDGKLDIVAAGQSDGVSVLLGNGAGGFGAATSFSTGFRASAVAVGDFNGDGKPDIAPAGSSAIAILIGDGNGGFAPSTNYVLNESPVDVTVGDFDGDGKLDAATANFPPDGSFPNLNGPTNDTTTLLLGDGAGKLRYASVLNTGANPFAVAAGDLNADGKPDLVIANVGNNITVLLGDGAGGFGLPSAVALGTQPRSVAIGDLNGDGKPDLVTANFSAGTVSIIPGDGGGGFGSPSQLGVPGFGPDYVAVGDFNNDGKPDVAVGYLNANSVSILLGDGAGGFGSPSNFSVPFGAQQIIVNDFNGDGKADLAVATISGISVLLGDGAGGFGAATTLQTAATASSVGVGDFNGDGKADLVAAVTNTNVVLVNLGDGRGGFAAPSSFRAGAGPVSLAVADYNADGNADVASANGDGTVSVLLGDGAGDLAAPVVYVTPGPVPRTVTSADFNSDGHPDLAVANQGGNVVPSPNPPPGNVSVLFNRCSAPPPLVPSLSVGDATVTEGDSGTVSATFNVSLSAASSQTVAVSFYTAAQGALKDVDYKSVSGRLSFAPGVTTQTITVPVVGDTLDEFDESFLVILAHPLNANVGREQARGTILDDDPPPSASINDVALDEGNAGTKQAIFTVSLSTPSGKPISIPFATADGSATAGLDYQATSGTLTFNPGQTALTLSVPVIGDTVVEQDEAFFVNLTGPVNVTTAKAQGVGTILNDDTSVQFGAAAQSVNEADGSVQVVVTRAGLLSGSSTVNYSTGDGTASERSDYDLALGMLRFAPGEASKIINVPITDDRFAEGDETFSVSLSNPVGVTIGTPPTLTVTIKDNDSSSGPSPVRWDASFDTSFFVRQHYHDFLNRESDAGGLAFWSNEIESCGPDAGCREVKRVNVSAAFFLSIEFQETGYLVYKTYKAAYGDIAQDKPVPVRLREFLSDTQEIGRGVQVGIGDWQTQLENNKRAYFDSFVTTPRFAAQYPNTLTAVQFVDRLNANAGGVLSQQERDGLAGDLSSGTKTRAQVLRSVAENPKLHQNEFNKAFVLMQFFGYLRRDPDSGNDVDFSGWQFWLSKLNQFGGNFQNAEMVKAFLLSTEYQQRFGQP